MGNPHEWVRNALALATTPLRDVGLALVNAALTAISTKHAVRKAVTYDAVTRRMSVNGVSMSAGDYERIYVIAIGKCAVDAATEIESILGEAITGGHVLDVREGTFNRLVSHIGTHPLPSQQNIEATREIAATLRQATARDLIIAVISGGGSSLLCDPYELSCESLAAIARALMGRGATIEELNTVRKHLSRVQGGQLAQLAHPATVVGIVFSDVPGNEISTIASGPLSKDPTTANDARAVLRKYRIEDADELLLTETPKDDSYFARVNITLIVSNEHALAAMRDRAMDLGYDAVIQNSSLEGNAAEVGARLASADMPRKTVYLFGGETTVVLRGVGGRGGRNQEAALSALTVVPQDRLFVALATDGKDHTDFAGALADSSLRDAAREASVDPARFLNNSDSTTFFEQMGGYLDTGPTGANVADIYFVVQG